MKLTNKTYPLIQVAYVNATLLECIYCKKGTEVLYGKNITSVYIKYVLKRMQRKHINCRSMFPFTSYKP